MDQSSLIVKDQVLIEAPISKVWEVLIAPKYIRQWDDLPQDFDEFYLEKGRVIEWSGVTRLTVAEAVPHEKLSILLYAQKWEKPAAEYNIAYTYVLSSADSRTALALEIGDFGSLANGQEYYDASLIFAQEVLPKIKNLAENKL